MNSFHQAGSNGGATLNQSTSVVSPPRRKMSRPALRLISTNNLSHDSWLNVRKQGIGSSDAAAAVGLNPYQSMLELCMVKTGRDGSMPKPDPDDESSPMYWGKILEPIVAQHYSKRTGHKVRRINAVLQHPDPDKAWMLANLDYAVVAAGQTDKEIQLNASQGNASQPVHILECKTAGEHGAKLWKHGVPEYVQCQVQHQLAVTGKQAADVCVLVCGQEIRIYRIERDDELIDRLIQLERKFWHYVETDTAPPADGSESAAQALQYLYPKDTGETIDFRDNPAMGIAFTGMLKLKSEIEVKQSAQDQLKQQIQQAMSNATKALFNHGTVTWKKSSDSTTLDTKRLLKIQPSLLQRYPLHKSGSRRFMVYADLSETHYCFSLCHSHTTQSNQTNIKATLLKRKVAFIFLQNSIFYEEIIMIKGLAITPPILGRISIGKIVEKEGKRLPQKDDQFSITTQIQNKDGWVKHPLDELLRQQQNQSSTKTRNTDSSTPSNQNGSHKLRTIPVRLLFNDPDLNLRAEYSMFDRQTGRAICVGNGETCKRFTKDGYEQLPCPSPDLCPLGKNGNCKPYGRLNVCITPDHITRNASDSNTGSLHQEDELGTFIFRTTGFNSIRTLAARLSYYQAVSGNLLSCLPLQLKLRGKSTTQSYRSAIYYVDLTVRDGISLNEAIQQALQLHQQRLEAGFQQTVLDQAAQNGFDNGLFELSEDEAGEVLEAFYVDIDEGVLEEQIHNVGSTSPVATAQHSGKLSLKQKLDNKIS